ncbi:DUF2330 domain-containing protein [Leptothoe sp. EHU-05/26/07-4]
MAAPVQAFCGFFVAKADSTLENTASQVVIAHSGNRSVFMMANDFQGDVQDFARIVPIPVLPSRDQVSVGDGALIEKLGAFTAPRLAQYFDHPCQQEYDWYRVIVFLASPIIVFFLLSWIWPRLNKLVLAIALLFLTLLAVAAVPSFLNQANKAGGPNRTITQSMPAVTVEDEFTVGEYDVVILSANESDDLVTWLQQNDYQVSSDATTMLQSYIDAEMKFFVVRVNLGEFQKVGGQFLRPIVLDYESDEFMLPIRLGTLNAKGDQDLIIHVLSPTAYAEIANYQTLPVPTDAESKPRWPSGHELPAFVQSEFGDFYETMFQRTHEKYTNAVFLEYATRIFGENIKCDPCAVAPEELPTEEDLKDMGVWWSEEFPETWITRLHVRYNSDTFPEDLRFQEVTLEKLAEKPGIAGRSFPEWAGVDFQARYVIRRPLGSAVCISRWRYQRTMAQAAENLAMLTGWDNGEIRQKMIADRRVNALDKQGQTKLHQAINENDLAKVQQLIEQGANVNIVGNQWRGMTPLVNAIANDQPEIIQRLLDNGADPNVSWRGEPILLWAIGFSDLTTVEQLLKAGVNDSTLQMVWETAQTSNNEALIEVLQPYVNPKT